MKEIYLANMWPQIVTKRGVKLFEASGYEVSGNWLNGKQDYAHASNIILPFADFGNPAKPPETSSDLWKRIASYILFPDSMVGWDFSSNRYELRKNPDTEILLNHVPNRFSHSRFSCNLIRHVYGQRDEIVIPLGIDTDSIKEVRDNSPHKGMRVLWNHMWRPDKGTYEAFSIIKSLAKKHPKVEFWIGQTDTWDTRPEALNFKQKCLSILETFQNMDNVKFFKRIKDQKEYWSWVSQADIGFSTALQEGFGLSMLEQEMAGIACVVPNSEVYPEIHTGCLIVDYNELENGLEMLISNPESRKSIAQSGMDNAAKYDTTIWVKNMLENIK